MKNPATNTPSCDKFNAFTEFLFDELTIGKTPTVRLRDGRLVEVDWYDAEDPDYTGFCHWRPESALHFSWNHDGTSITSKTFDMMETA